MTDRDQTNDLELLTMNDVVRIYHYPRSVLRDELYRGVIPHFRLSEYARCYIPRQAIEAHISSLASARKKTHQ